ncbi:MAG: hypothetical protein HGA45_16655 [Chloroflexales bacterium]|nr:hypothetical protein [Chloroflexales bacterium]
MEALEQLVADGELRYIYGSVDARGGQGLPGMGGSSSLSSWIVSRCTVVEGFATETRNMGAPGGTEASAGDSGTSTGRNGFGSFTIQLYDCAARRS